jgi:hypothetical protein
MEIELYSKLNEMAGPIERLGNQIARSGSLRCTRIEQGTFVLMFIMSKKISLAEFIETYDLIDGIPVKKSKACFAEFRKRGGKVFWVKDGSDGKKATAKFVWEGETLEVSFTMEDAKRQNLVKPNSNWTKVPDYMLRARVITKALGMLAPEIIAGTDDYDDSGLRSTPRFDLGAPPVQPQTSTGSPIIDITSGPAPEEPPPEPPRSKSEPPSSKPEPPSSKPEPPSSVEPSEEPVPPAEPVEPKGKTGPKPQPARKAAELDQKTIKQIADLLEGHYVHAANWMMHEGWIPQAPAKLNVENQAAEWLVHTLPRLSKAHAKTILTKGLAFMSGPEEIQL